MKEKLLFISLVLSSFYYAQDYSANKIPDALKKNANAVIRERNSDYIIKSVDEIEILTSSTITILNKSGDSFAPVMIPYNKRMKVDDIKVNLLDENGKVVKKYTKKDFSDFSHTPSFGLYVDDRILVLNPTSVSHPYTIQYSYKITSRNTVFIGDFSPLSAYNISAELVRRRVKNTSGIKLNTKITNSEFGKVNVSSGIEGTEYTYLTIPAIDHENYAPTIEYLEPKVEFSLEKFSLEGKQGDLQNWDNFGKWYYENLLEPVTQVTPEIKKEVQSLGLTGSTEEKVRKIYHYMQDKTRYVFVAMGIGGWQPMNTEEVRIKGYGDCKALTNYMRTLLAAADIPSYYAIIKSGFSSEIFDKDFPKMGGNHVVLMVPTDNGNIWLENTSQQIAFNHLSFSTTNRNVLAVKETGIELINTPVYDAEKSRESIKAHIKIKTDNSIEANADFHYTGGQYDFHMPLLQMNTKDRHNSIINSINYMKINDLRIDNFTGSRSHPEISYQVTLKAQDYSKKIGEDIFFRIMPFYESSFPAAGEERKLPFETPFAYQDNYEIEFETPEGYVFSELPAPAKITSEFGEYSVQYQLLNNKKLKVKRILTIKKGIYRKEKFNSYYDFRRSVTNADNTKLLITKNNIHENQSL